MANNAFVVFVLASIVALYGLVQGVGFLVALPWLVVIYRVCAVLRDGDS